jgi:chromosome segregation ATPase
MENEIEQVIETAAEETESSESLKREIETGKAVIAELNQTLADRELEIEKLNNEKESTKKRLDETAQSLAAAVGAYRELIVKANPGVLADMISGDSIEMVNASVESARAVMEKARREVEAEAARVRVPAGAPPRAPQDFAALTAREKIQIGIKG